MYINRSAVDALWSEPCLAARVRRIHRLIVGVYDDALRAAGLTVAQLDLLTTLMTSPRRTRAVDLAGELRLERSSLARNLARLRQRGYIATAPGGNGRELRLEVTASGRAAVEQAAEAWYAAQRHTAERLGDDGVAALDLLLDRLNHEASTTKRS